MYGRFARLKNIFFKLSKTDEDDDYNKTTRAMPYMASYFYFFVAFRHLDLWF